MILKHIFELSNYVIAWNLENLKYTHFKKTLKSRKMIFAIE